MDGLPVGPHLRQRQPGRHRRHRGPLPGVVRGGRAGGRGCRCGSICRLEEDPGRKRAAILNRAAEHLEANADSIAAELTREEGKALALARDEVLRSAQTLRFYAVEGQTFTGEVYPNDDPDQLVYSQREPLGVVTVIAPWNFPVSIPARKIAPALVTGNTVVFKPSSEAPLSGYRLAEALIKAGLPKGVLNFITGSATEIGAAITEAPAVRAISFTGSSRAGEQIHRAAPLTTRTQMELGGKNPLIVMEDADLDRAVDLTIKGGFSLSGQAARHQPRAGGRIRQGGIHRTTAGESRSAKGRQRHDRWHGPWAAGLGQAAGDRAALYRHRQVRGNAAVRRRAPGRRRL